MSGTEAIRTQFRADTQKVLGRLYLQGIARGALLGAIAMFLLLAAFRP